MKEINKSDFMFNITTNGTLFDNPKVKDYLLRDKRRKSVGVSLDGCKEIHNYNRSNSFDLVMKNFDWWRENFPWCSTKSTINHEALPYLLDSVKFLTSLELEYIFMNIVFEPVWEEGDDSLFYDQLIKIADYLIENNRYQKYNVTLFNEYILTESPEALSKSWCGCGNSMMAIDYKGNLYPCLRFLTLSKKEPYIIGDIYNGINSDRLLPFRYCHNLRTEKCKNCNHKLGCGWCTAFNYDETDSLFERVDYMCKMHLARVEANKYFFDKIKSLEGREDLMK
jgi:radical SAM peptide maturase (CXXX-repeat target family)